MRARSLSSSLVSQKLGRLECVGNGPAQDPQLLDIGEVCKPQRRLLEVFQDFARVRAAGTAHGVCPRACVGAGTEGGWRAEEEDG